MIVETSKKALYAAVGAPVVAARKMSERVSELTGKLSEDLSKEYEIWAKEGEKVVHKMTDRKMVEEFVEDVSARMDFDQIQEQVGKLREQLEDMLSNWRSSFRPTTPKAEAPKAEAPKAEAPKAVAKPAAKPAAKKPAARKPAAKSTAARKPAAKATTS